MSQKEINEDDFIKIIIAGGIGVFTLSYYLIKMCCKCNFKKKFKARINKEEEKIALKKVESKSEKINNDINNDIINIEEIKEGEKKIKEQNINENNKYIPKEEKNYHSHGNNKKINQESLKKDICFKLGMFSGKEENKI